MKQPIRRASFDTVILTVRLWALMVFCGSTAWVANALPGGTVYQTSISGAPYEMKYTSFIPESASVIRGILIHQHGCTMEGTGAATAYDIQYQALAKKWGLAVVGPDLYHSCDNPTSGWVFPEKGSGAALIAALDSIARRSGHPEVKTAPWLLWGHSGGGYWVRASGDGGSLIDYLCS